MTEFDVQTAGLSRRNVLLGLGAAAAITALPARANAAPGAARSWLPSAPQAVDAPISGLTYIGLDAQQFFPAGDPSNRLYEDLTGSKVNGGGFLFASLPLPAGSTLYQINVGYQQEPIVYIHKRTLQQAPTDAAPELVFSDTLHISPGGPFSSSIKLPNPITIDRESTYTISFFVGPGSAIFGCTLGYLPPTQSFVPFTGPDPRVLDTRLPGPLTGKLLPDQEKIVPLGFAGARSAVLNLTVTGTVGGGFVAVFPAGIGWPGNSSINWSASNQNVANGVISAVDGNGAIKIRGGANATHVVIDRIGFMI